MSNEKITCWNCQEENSAQDELCINCGEPLHETQQLHCPFCGKPAERKSLDLSDGDSDPSLAVNNVGIVTFAWTDDMETAIQNSVASCICTEDKEHIFFIFQ
jgi:ribosomal protein L37E